MARRPQGPPAFATAPTARSRWLIIGLAVALIIATGTAVWALTRPSSDSTGTADPNTPISGSPSDDASPANGCLGGLDATTAVVAAQDEAALSPSGAASFAATFLRWLMQYPRPTDDLASTGAVVATDSALREVLASDLGTAEAGIVEEGSEVRATTLDQRYEIAAFTEDEAIVATTIRLVDQAGLEEPVETLAFVKLAVDDDHWRFDYWPTEAELNEADLPAGDDDLGDYREYLFAEGTAYEGVC